MRPPLVRAEVYCYFSERTALSRGLVRLYTTNTHRLTKATHVSTDIFTALPGDAIYVGKAIRFVELCEYPYNQNDLGRAGGYAGSYCLTLSADASEFSPNIMKGVDSSIHYEESCADHATPADNGLTNGATRKTSPLDDFLGFPDGQDAPTWAPLLSQSSVRPERKKTIPDSWAREDPPWDPKRLIEMECPLDNV